MNYTVLPFYFCMKSIHLFCKFILCVCWKHSWYGNCEALTYSQIRESCSVSLLLFILLTHLLFTHNIVPFRILSLYSRVFPKMKLRFKYQTMSELVITGILITVLSFLIYFRFQVSCYPTVFTCLFIRWNVWVLMPKGLKESALSCSLNVCVFTAVTTLRL